MLYTMPQIFSSVLLEYSKSGVACVYNVDIWKLGCGLTFIISRLKYYGEFPRWFRGKKKLGWGRSLGEENGNPLQCFCQEKCMDRGVWWATTHGVAKSWTWLRD